MADHIVVGGGHNGLVTACYLARAGLDVLVLEQSAKLGGGCRTDELAFDEYLRTSCVITAIDPKVALLELLDPPRSGTGAAALGATHRSNAVQLLVLLATTALPGYAHAQPGDWNGLQSYVGRRTTTPSTSRARRRHSRSVVAGTRSWLTSCAGRTRHPGTRLVHCWGRHRSSRRRRRFPGPGGS